MTGGSPNVLINGGHRPRQSVIKSHTAHGSTMTITRSEKRCFIRYVNTVMSQAIQKFTEEKNKMIENGSWNFITTTLQQQAEERNNSGENGEILSPRGSSAGGGGRRQRNVLANLGDLAVIEYWKPLEVVGTEELEQNVELFDRLQDGVVFLHLIEKIQNGLIDWNKVNKRSIITPLEGISKFQKIENQAIVIDLSESVGCQIVGIGPSELAEGSPQPLLALLWQLIRQDVTKRLNVMHSLRLIALKEEHESVVEFMKLPAQQLLTRFVNYNLKQTKSKKVVVNFSEDWKDGEAFCHLIKNIVDINNRFNGSRVSVNGEDDDEDEAKENIAQKQFTDEQIEEIMAIEDREERSKRIIAAINELGLNPNMVHIEAEDIHTGVNTLIMTMVSSLFNATNLNGLQSDLTEDAEKMTQLRREILDSFLVMMKDDMPEINKPEMKVFLELVKKLSDVNIKEIEEKIVEQKVHKYKVEARKLKKQAYVQYNLSEQYKKRIEELEKIIADQKVTIQEKEKVIADQKEVISEKEKKNQEQAERIKELEEELRRVNDSRKDDLKVLGAEDFLNGENITAEEIRKKTSQKIEELVKRVKVLKETLIQTRKDLNYGMTLSSTDAETKLAEFRFGQLTVERLTTEFKPTYVGMVEKRGRLKKNWKKRYFILLNNYVFYFTKEKGGALKGFLRIEECEIDREEEENKKGFVFHIKTMGRVLSCRTESYEEREEWIKWIYENSRIILQNE